MAPTTLIPLALAPLILWRLYRRFRSHVGQQTVKPVRTALRMALFAVVIVLLASATVPHPPSLIALCGGVAGGLVTAFAGLRLTRFERTPGGLVYHPNPYFGIALFLLLAGRLIYRLVELSMISYQPGGLVPPPMQSPLTFFLIGLLSGYYVAYYAGVLIRSRRLAGAGGE